jgi:hypothetical protein
MVRQRPSVRIGSIRDGKSSHDAAWALYHSSRLCTVTKIKSSLTLGMEES